MNREILKEAGIDVETTIRRMGGREDFVLKYLRKFPQDSSCQELREAMECEDMANLLTAAHTLKGVSANLGMDGLSQLCNEVVISLRAGNTSGLREKVSRICEEYEHIIQAITKI